MNRILILLALFVCAFSGLKAQPAANPSVLLELFSSEGCESCPYADEFGQELLRIADSTNSPVFLIDYHVDIWNRSGWYDSLSTPEFSERQRTYMKKVNQQAMFTPMMFVNGQYGMPAGWKKEVGQAIFKELYSPAKVGLSINANMINNRKSLTISYNLSNKIDSAELLLVLVENEVVNKVTAGENKGKTLTHHHVARQLFRMPLKTDFSGIVNMPLSGDFDLQKYSLVGFVQKVNSWQVLATDQIYFRSN